MERVRVSGAILAIFVFVALIIVAGDEDCDYCYSPPAMAGKFFISGLVIIAGAVFYRSLFLQMESVIFRIDRQPLLDTNEATDSVPFAGEGTVEPAYGQLLTSPYTNTQCVYYHSIRERYVGGKGNRWVLDEEKVSFVPFYLKDRRGKLLIDLTNIDADFSGYAVKPTNMNVPDPSHSEIDAEALVRQQEYTETAPVLGLGILGQMGLSTRTRFRKSEFALRPGTKIFAYGMVSRKGSELVLHEEKDHPLIISRKSKDAYVAEFFEGESLVYLAHLFIALGFTMSLFAANYFLGMPFAILLLPLLAGNGIVIGSMAFTLYNRIISLHQRALNALSNIEIELKRRADLIPNIVRIVKEYARYEKEINQILTEARVSIAFSKEPAAAAAPVIPALIASIERYPALRAAENFQSLMRELIDTEERIAYSREFYNRSVMKYNVLIRQIPFILVSLPLGMKEKEYLVISRGEATAPKVSS